MAKHCEICGKTAIKAAKISFSHKQNVHRQEPNLQTVKVNQNGTVKESAFALPALEPEKYSALYN